MKKQLILFFLSVLFSLSWCFAQKIGKPFLQNYSPKQYKAAIQNWAIVQDKRGILYFANDQGVLEYDGKDWNLIRTSNNSAVRSLAIDDKGIVYVGASNEFGYLAPDVSGKLRYVSLKYLLEEKDKKFEDVYSTHVSPQGIYFHTDNILFRFQPDKKSIQKWYAPADSYFFLTFLVNNVLFVHDLKAGLMQMKSNQLQKIYGGEKFINERIYVMLPYNDSRTLIGTRNQGLFIYQPNVEGTEVFVPFKTEVDDFLLQNQLYNGSKVADDLFALCTRYGGVVLIDIFGRKVDIIDKNYGLQDKNTRFAYLTKENSLFLALDNGISQVSIHTPIRFWDESLGLEGTIRDIVEHQGKTYVGTSLGVFCLEEGRFRRVSGIETDCWTLLNFVEEDNPENPQLLAGTNQGIYHIISKEATIIKQTNSAVLKLYQSIYNPHRIYVGLKDGLMSMHFEFDIWLDEGKIKNIQDEIYSIAEESDSKLWLGTFIQGFIQATLDHNHHTAKIERFKTEQGLPSNRDNKIYTLHKKLLFATQNGLYKLDKSQKKFIPDTLLGIEFSNSKRGIYRLAVDNEQNIWASDVSNQSYPIGVGLLQKDKTYRWYDAPLRRLPEFSEPIIYPDNEGVIWIGGSEGLFRYETHQKHRINQKYHTLIRKVILGEDSVIFNGTNYKVNLEESSIFDRIVSIQQPEELRPEFFYSNQFSIEFRYVAPFFESEANTEYSHFLQGYDKTWSLWSKDNKKQYNSLPEGNYTFYVKARNIYGKESEVALYSFKILPPWYRTAWAYILYTLLAIGVVIMSIRVNTHRLRRQKRKLERIVEQRTKEIKQKNEELEKKQEEILVQAENLRKANDEITIQNIEIEKKNEDMTASISYASRIQKAMLPRMENIKESFPDSFIFLRPRDIVSGDFYWFAETPLEARFAKDPLIKNGTVSVFKGFGGGKKVIAAVDCTGHGIPGAFVSMMGDAYLDQIVNLEGVTQPQLILKELHDYVRHALKQDDSSGNLDGMDMALCTIDPKNLTLEFAGAKNGLVYIQDNEIFHIRGDKYGIGGFQFEQGEKNFTRHIISIHAPTSIYLFSDGLEDQFGGEKGKKFSIKRMKELFLEHYKKPMEEQKILYEQALEDWMKNAPQVDDVLLLGIHLDPKQLKNPF